MKIHSQYNLGPKPAKRVEVAIGNWDMVALSLKHIDVGINYTVWKSWHVLIRNDTDDVYTALGINGKTSGHAEHTSGRGDTIMSLYRGVGGMYNHVDYDTAVFERGVIVLEY